MERIERIMEIAHGDSLALHLGVRNALIKEDPVKSLLAKHQV